MALLRYERAHPPSAAVRHSYVWHAGYAILSQMSAMRTHILFSNYEFRAYRKRTGNVSLHLSSHLLLENKDNGHIDYLFKPTSAHLTLQNKARMGLSLRWTSEPDHVFSSLHVYHVWLWGDMNFSEYLPGVAWLYLRYTKKYDPDHLWKYHRHVVIVKELALQS